jgi:mono/diheme cytochrome c family protein
MKASVVVGLAGLVLLAAGCDGVTQTGVKEETATDPVERGRYLVSLAGCNDCHTPGYFLGMPDMTRVLGGSEVGFEMPGLGVFHGPNLTPDIETGLGRWSEEQIIAAFTAGKRPDGRELVPIMPWRAFAGLTAEDKSAIAVYLKSLPPVSNQVPGPFGPNDTPTSFVMRIVPPLGAGASPAPPAP